MQADENVSLSDDLLTAATSASIHNDCLEQKIGLDFDVVSAAQDANESSQRGGRGEDELFLSQRLVEVATKISSRRSCLDLDSINSAALLQQDSIINLDDFVDVITTYKCKFCDFNCDWVGGLVGHLRDVHCIGGGGVIGGASSPLEQLVLDRSTMPLCDDASTTQPSMRDKEIFLCGQCNQSFLSLDLCKLHMIQQHRPEDVVDHAQISPPCRSRPQPNKLKSKFKQSKDHGCHDDVKPQSPVNECKTVVESLGKRKVKTPKALAEDYYLPPKKREYRRCSVDNKSLKCKVEGCNQSNETEDCINAAGVRHRHASPSHDVGTELERCSKCPYHSAGLKEHEHKEAGPENEKKKKTLARRSSGCHRKPKHKQQKQDHLCSECRRNFADAKCLRKHVLFVHEKLKPYVCHVCGHTSARKAMLDLHLRQHTGEKPFACGECEYRTADHNSLRRHKMRHSGEKPYKCPHCPYTCIQTISYKTHLENKHPGSEGLFCCKVCPYRSVSYDNYVDHVRGHGGSVALDEIHQPPVASSTRPTSRNIVKGSSETKR